MPDKAPAPPPTPKEGSSSVQATPPPPKSDAPTDRSTDFTAVEGGAGNEQYSGSTLLVVAYASIWVILMAWIFLLWRKQATLATRLGALEAAIDRAAAAKTGSKS